MYRECKENTGYETSRQVGLKINLTNTQIMTNKILSKNVNIDGPHIEQTASYKYLDHETRNSRENQTCELYRRIGLTWAAFGNLRGLSKPELIVCLN